MLFVNTAIIATLEKGVKKSLDELYSFAIVVLTEKLFQLGFFRKFDSLGELVFSYYENANYHIISVYNRFSFSAKYTNSINCALWRNSITKVSGHWDSVESLRLSGVPLRHKVKLAVECSRTPRPCAELIIWLIFANYIH